MVEHQSGQYSFWHIWVPFLNPSSNSCCILLRAKTIWENMIKIWSLNKPTRTWINGFPIVDAWAYAWGGVWGRVYLLKHRRSQQPKWWLRRAGTKPGEGLNMWQSFKAPIKFPNVFSDPKSQSLIVKLCSNSVQHFSGFLLQTFSLPLLRNECSKAGETVVICLIRAGQ